MEEGSKTIHNHFEAGANCQVFNGPISGCVFAMPGSNVSQLSREPLEELSDEKQDLICKLTPIFYGDAGEAKSFLTKIQGAKPTQITDMVNLLVKQKKISDLSRKHQLWKVLHDFGIYEKSESNWNQQVK